jgi:hypothetical protein
MDRVSLHVGRAMTWYQSQTDTVQTLLKVLVIMVCLYVAFGGRFGLEYFFHPQKGGGPKFKYDDYYPKQQRQYQKGNYEAGNAYDQYYNSRRRQESPPQHQQRHQDQQQQQYNRYSSSSSSYDHKDDYHQSRRQPHQGSSSSSSFHFPNLFDGSFQSMTILAGIAYFCHRNGINPMQALMMMNLMAGGRGRGFRRGFGGGGMFGRRPGGMHYGGRPGGRWF